MQTIYFFRWTSTTNEECRTASINIAQNQPDACITKLNGAVWGTSRGFGEVKCFSQADNKYLASKDLVRLGHFTKNAIDVHDMDAVLAFQVMGRHAFFYITKLIHDG